MTTPHTTTTTTTVPVPAAPAKDPNMTPTTNPTPPKDRDLPRRRRARNAVIAGIAAAIGSLAMTAGPAVADDCPNATLRAQNNSTSLPECRAYELVTSPFKEGFAIVNQPTYTDNAVAYTSLGNFAGNGMGALGNQYVARRTATGWQTTASNPSGPDYVSSFSARGGAEALSADLGSSLWLMRRTNQSDDLMDYYLRTPDGVFTRIGPAANPATRPPGSPGTGSPFPLDSPGVPNVSSDLSHVVFGVPPTVAFPGDSSTGTILYEYVGTGNDRPRLVGVDNTGALVSTGGTCANGISNDGRVVFFQPPCGGTVWARINGTTSIHMSASACTRVCTGSDDAGFQGMAVDGSRAFFTTSAQLVDGDTDQTSDLYACDIPPGTPAPVVPFNRCAALTEVSGAATGADVQNAVGVSKDGSRVYFFATGVLASNHGFHDAAAVAGDHNLYLWQKDAAHPSGETVFVGKVDLSFSAVSDDGRYLAFSTSDALVTAGPGADTDTAADLYRYDAQTETIQRLSTTTSGAGGDQAGADVVFNGPRAMAADGRTLVFQTSEQLAPHDTDTASDVYEWHDGQVSAITTGGAQESAISPSGNNVFFNTSQPLTAADSDTNFDLYTARINGGLDLTQPTPCTEDQCRAASSAPPALATPPPNVSGGVAVPDVDPVFSLRAVTVAQRKRLAATGRVTLTGAANTPGTVSATATVTIGGKLVGVGSARRVMAAPGTFKLNLELSKRARTQLAAKGKLAVKITVRDSKVALPRSTTLKLTHAKTKNRAAKSSLVAGAAIAVGKVPS
ncbi:hypothetical protein [Baekduia sp.]|jgi:hypothetical protein|uniref:hypothetical protein n=1 Tax=Baekduia sp. TaxID=2600305 RepID=UPI002DFE21C9|nr:hypothetical protein [Baekduia sp.]